jgi:putative SOS response-associated peptidase YedK
MSMTTSWRDRTGVILYACHPSVANTKTVRISAMCGHFTLRARLNDILAAWGYEHAVEYAQRYNICPSQQIPIVTGDHTAKLVKWGLVPSWAEDAKIGTRMLGPRRSPRSLRSVAPSRRDAA